MVMDITWIPINYRFAFQILIIVSASINSLGSYVKGKFDLILLVKISVYLFSK